MITNSDRIRELFETTPAFSEISYAIDNFVIPAQGNTQSIDTSILEVPEIEVPRRLDKKYRKRRRASVDDDGPAKSSIP